MIVGIGDNCIDHYLSPLDIKCPGGNVVNVAVNLKKHGESSLYIGTVGNDENGSLILSSLADFGLDTTFISEMEGPTGLTEIEVVNGEYEIKYEEYGVSNSIHLTEDVYDFLKSNASIIHLSITGNAIQLVKELHKLGVPLSCDISNFYLNHPKEYWEEVLPYLDFVFVSGGSEQSVDSIRKIIAEITEFGPQKIIVTRGSKGVFASWEGEEYEQASLISAEEVVDPLGAGDAFISGFLSSVTKDSNQITDHLLVASQWAREACSHFRAW